MKRQFTLLFSLLFVSLITFGQSRVVTGNVTDENGDAAIAATVKVTGSETGTVTDLNGDFSLEVPENAESVTISYIGMQTQVVPITEGDLDVVMVAGDNFLDEVVVMGYYETNREQLTGSAVQVSSEDIEQVPVTSVDQALQGKVAGLTFSGESGTPGATGAIRIRGISSITAGNEPLFVIDGVPMTNNNYGGGTGSVSNDGQSSFTALASINQNDIESITVLKDASAIAAYGARGSNGVIVITTKKGSTGKTSFNFMSSYGVSNDATEGPQILTADQQLELQKDAIFNTFGEAYGFTKDQALEFGANNNLLYFGPDGYTNTDWADVITNEDAPLYEANLSASGGDEISNFYANFGYLNRDATVIGAEYERLTGALRYTRDVTENVTFNTNNTLSYGKQDGGLEQSAYFSSPRAAKYFTPSYEPVFNEEGNYNFNASYNPVWVQENDIHDNKLTRIMSNNSINWNTPIAGLDFTSRYSIDYSLNDYKNFGNRTHGDYQDVNGGSFRRNSSYRNKVFQNTLNYIFDLDGSHNFGINVIQEYQSQKTDNLSAYAEGFAADGLTNLDQAGSPQNTNSSFSDWYIASYTGVVNYDFNDKYVLNGSFRREGNSRFNADRRWGNFWALGAAWNIHQEEFMETDMIDFLKLRGSFGKTGNANVGLNQFQATLGYDADYDGAAAVYPAVFGNDELGWENANNYEAGLDFGLFNRLNGSFSWYQRDTYDMLLNVPLSLTQGFTSQTRNVGDMTNQGIELELNVDAVQTEDFQFSIGGNLATNDNEVTTLAKDALGEEINITTTKQRVETGHHVYEWYLPTWAGVDPQTGLDTWYVEGMDGETTSTFANAQRSFQGASFLPTLTAGINANINYKGFSIAANGYYAGGHKVYEEWHRYTNGTDLYPILYNGVSSLMDRWQEPGDITRISKIEYTGKPWQRHSKFLFDGDYFRLKNLTFGYDLPSDFLSGLGIQNAQIFLRGTNIYTKVKDENLVYDPEIQISGDPGSTELTNPVPKSFIGGVNIKF